MPPLDPPDSFHLAAAVGWLELGNHVEAAHELGKISAALLEHPDVLEVQWAICAAGKDWEGGLRAADLLLAKAPDCASAWLHRAYALRRVKRGGLRQAWQALRPALEKFPKEAVIPYNLACYSAQLGELEEAWAWLQKAITSAGEAKSIKQMALADADLEPPWVRIRELGT